MACNEFSGTNSVSNHLPKLPDSSGIRNCGALSTALTSTPNAKPEIGSVTQTKSGDCHRLLEEVVIDGKPYAKSVVDALDDDDSVVLLTQGCETIPLRRLGETQHEERVRRINNQLADRIFKFVREIQEWEHTLTIECKNFVYADKKWAYDTLPIVAGSVRLQKVLVASLNTDCLMKSIKGAESIRTAHWLMKFANHEGEKFQMEPKGNLCSRKYKFYSEFCLDQSVE